MEILRMVIILISLTLNCLLYIFYFLIIRLQRFEEMMMVMMQWL